MKSVRYILALGAFFVVAVGVSACGSGVPGNSVADVAGNPISTVAFNHWMYVAATGQAAQTPGAPVIVPTDPPTFDACVAQVRKTLPSLAKTPSSQIRADCKQLFTSLSSQVMDFLIKAYWYQADAAALHVKVSTAEVTQQFDQDRKQQFPTAAAFQTFLTQTGQTLQDILFRVRVNALFTKLVNRHVSTVTPAQIAAYYAAHMAAYGTPESLNMRMVLTKTQSQAAAAKAALAAGQSWDAVAKKYSTDSSTKNKGGLLTGVTKGTEDPALENAAFSAPKGKVMGPVKGQFGYYVFEVNSIKPGHQETLAQATSTIRTALTTSMQNNAQSAVDAHAKKMWMHKTTCRAAYAMDDYSGFKAPKSSTTATPTTPPATTP
jgi:foldase protein PrsA